MIAIERIPEVDRYILGWIYNKSDSARTPQEHAWIKIGKIYYDPTLHHENSSNLIRYSPSFELTLDEMKSVIYSNHTEEEQLLMQKGLCSPSPPTIADIIAYRKSL